VARALLLLAASLGLAGQAGHWPVGLFCGGNQMRFEGTLTASRASGTVLFYDSRDVIPGASVQVQIKGHTEVLLDLKADAHGRFKVPKLHPGTCWLGVSSLGFNLHYWDLTIARNGGPKTIRVELSLGT
jgi:hypothetical protein